jgi:hypothetical protein
MLRIIYQALILCQAFIFYMLITQIFIFNHVRFQNKFFKEIFQHLNQYFCFLFYQFIFSEPKFIKIIIK